MREYWRFLLSFLLTPMPLAQYSNVAALSRSDLANYSMFFLHVLNIPSRNRVPDTHAAQANKQTQGKTAQSSRGHLHLCETQQKFTFVLSSLNRDQKEKACGKLEKMDLTVSYGNCPVG